MPTPQSFPKLAHRLINQSVKESVNFRHRLSIRPPSIAPLRGGLTRLTRPCTIWTPPNANTAKARSPRPSGPTDRPSRPSGSGAAHAAHALPHAAPAVCLPIPRAFHRPKRHHSIIRIPVDSGAEPSLPQHTQRGHSKQQGGGTRRAHRNAHGEAAGRLPKAEGVSASTGLERRKIGREHSRLVP